MRKGGGKSKGSGFERTVAKLIAKAFKPFGIHQRECWRSVLSGGHSMSSGDLIFSPRLEKLFPYSVECKNYREIHWERFLMPKWVRKKSWPEWQWLTQCIEGAEKRDNLEPLLVMKENRGPIYCYYRLDAKKLNKGVPEWRLVEFKDFLERAVRRAKEK